MNPAAADEDAPLVLSFDVEEHHRIEAAASLTFDEPTRRGYRDRIGPSTRWLLERLRRGQARATFFILGQVARDDPALIREIQDDGHEIASHGWDHRRVLAMTPEEFRQDLRLSREALEDAAGCPVVGYRAPTFSIVERTAWALDVLAEEGFLYDSSIYPVRHDRYGVPHAPRSPFLAVGPGGGEILEMPPATLRVRSANLPAGGGGYFRLFPTVVVERAIRQARRDGRPPLAMLYFHPWEFDPEQPRLPLRRLSRFRTYVGIGRARGRLEALIARHAGRFATAGEVARDLLDGRRDELSRFPLAPIGAGV